MSTRWAACFSGVDLYKNARDFPATLNGAGKVLPASLIRAAGISRGSTRWHTRQGHILRAQRGIYVAGTPALDLLDRIRAALHASAPGAAVGFHTAALLWGFGVPASDDIHLVMPMGSLIPHRRGVRVHEAARPFVPQRRLGVPCAPAARTAIDLARALDRPTALAVLDAALYADACTRDDLLAEVSRHTRLRGVLQARELVPLADPRADCRQESHLRLLLHDGGLRGFEPQVEVYEPGDSSPFADFRLDLAHRTYRVAAEYDGESHTRGRLRADRRRHNRLSEMGWRMRYFTDHDLYRAPDGILRTLRHAIVESRHPG